MIPADYVTVQFDRLACRSADKRRRSVVTTSLPSDYLAFLAANPG